VVSVYDFKYPLAVSTFALTTPLEPVIEAYKFPLTETVYPLKEVV